MLSINKYCTYMICQEHITTIFTIKMLYYSIIGHFISYNESNKRLASNTNNSESKYINVTIPLIFCVYGALF